MKFGTAPKDLSFLRRMFFPPIRRPHYLPPGKDDLNAILAAQKSVIKQGVVVLGACVQANNLLFGAGLDDHPGELLLSFDPAIAPETLRAIAHDLYGIKGKLCLDPGSNAISQYLADEMTRVVGREVPAELNRGHSCFCTTIIFRRRSLPTGVLTGQLMPVLVHPISRYAMVLPHPYWTEEGAEQYSRSDSRRA